MSRTNASLYCYLCRVKRGGNDVDNDTENEGPIMTNDAMEIKVRLRMLSVEKCSLL